MNSISQNQATVLPLPPSSFGGTVRYGPRKWLVLSEAHSPGVQMTVSHDSIALDATAETFGKYFDVKRRYLEKVDVQVVKRPFNIASKHPEPGIPHCYLTIYHRQPDTPRFLQFIYSGLNAAGLAEALVHANYVTQDAAQRMVAAMR